MIGSGQILTEGNETFVPVLTRLWEIAQEFIPYFIYIALGALGISLLWKAVKYIMGYLNRKTKGTYGESRERKRQRAILKEYQDHGYKLDERDKKNYDL